MSLREKINEQFNIALKNKNKSLISTLRLILAAIKQRDIENRSAEKKDEVKDVQQGYECGVTNEEYNDIKKGDIIETFSIQKEAREL